MSSSEHNEHLSKHQMVKYLSLRQALCVFRVGEGEKQRAWAIMIGF